MDSKYKNEKYVNAKGEEGVVEEPELPTPIPEEPFFSEEGESAPSVDFEPLENAVSEPSDEPAHEQLEIELQAPVKAPESMDAEQPQEENNSSVENVEKLEDGDEK